MTTEREPNRPEYRPGLRGISQRVDRDLIARVVEARQRLDDWSLHSETQKEG